ncbi:MAG TPA: phosphoribosylformylglycinamidine synthase subunit PurS [Acidimicrobiales bacterium]|nr:phosphoribosylformylglycinamidine synthase subunit PurS [Acidimicrobiales bacterium]
MNFDVSVLVRGVEGIADPEGRTVERALGALGFAGASSVRVGKVINLCLSADDTESARVEVEEMCDRLLANPVIERYEITIVPTKTS